MTINAETNDVSVIRDAIAFKPSSFQEQIISLAMQLMENHYLFDSDMLYVKCLGTIKNISASAISSAIAELLNKHIFIKRKALDRFSLLDNPHRKEIFGLISKIPGLNITRIAKKLGMFVTTARWHVDTLEEFHLIRGRLINNQLFYFPASTSNEHDQINILLNKNGIPEIIGFVECNSRPTMNNLLKSVSIAKTTLLRKIKELVENGVIVVSRNSNGDSNLAIHDSIKDFLAQRLKEL